MGTDSENPFAAPLVVDIDPSASPALANQRQSLASLLERFVGALIDGLALLPLIGTLVVGVSFVLLETNPAFLETSNEVVDMVFGLFIWGVAFLPVNGYLLATRGQTVGKWIMRTQIVSNGGRLLPFGPLLVKRYLVLALIQSIPMIGGPFALIDVLVIFRDNRKCLHDEFAGTKVIKLPRGTPVVTIWTEKESSDSQGSQAPGWPEQAT